MRKFKLFIFLLGLVCLLAIPYQNFDNPPETEKTFEDYEELQLQEPAKETSSDTSLRDKGLRNPNSFHTKKEFIYVDPYAEPVTEKQKSETSEEAEEK